MSPSRVQFFLASIHSKRLLRRLQLEFRASPTLVLPWPWLVHTILVWRCWTWLSLDDGRSLNWSCSFSLFTNPLFSLQRSSSTKFIDRKHKEVGVGKEKIDTLVRFPIVDNNNKRLWTGYCIAIVQGPRCAGNTFQMIYCLKRFFGITFKKTRCKERLNPEKSVRFCLNLFRYCAATIYVCTSLAFDVQNGNGLQFFRLNFCVVSVFPLIESFDIFLFSSVQRMKKPEGLRKIISAPLWGEKKNVVRTMTCSL